MELILNEIFFKPSAEVSDYLDVVMKINGLLYDFYCGNLKLRTEAFQEKNYKKVEELVGLKEKHGDLKLIELRHSYDCEAYLLISGGILFCSRFYPSNYSKVFPQEISIVGEILSEKNKDVYEEYLSLKISEDLMEIRKANS